MCIVLTDDTRLARPERLEEVEEVCRRWTCDGRVTQEQTHISIGTSCTWRARDANGTCSPLRAFLLEATLTLASAPQRVIARMCVDRCHKSSPGPGAKAIGSSTRTHGQPAHARECQPRADRHVREQHRQNTDDLATLRSVPLTGTARHERQQRGTITIGNPVYGAFEPNGCVNRSRDMVTPAVYPRLFSHHFDIQSTARKSQCHSYSCRLTRACFLTTLTFRALRGNHSATVTPAVYPRLLLSTSHSELCMDTWLP